MDLEKEMEGVFRTFLFRDPKFDPDFDRKLRDCLGDYVESDSFDEDAEGGLKKYVDDKSLPFSPEDREKAVRCCRMALIAPENVYDAGREYVFSLNLGGGGPSFDMEFRYRDDGNRRPELVSGTLIGHTWGQKVCQDMPAAMAEELFTELIDMGTITVPAPDRQASSMRM